LADELYRRKSRGESYEDVIRRHLGLDVEGSDDATEETTDCAGDVRESLNQQSAPEDGDVLVNDSGAGEDESEAADPAEVVPEDIPQRISPEEAREAIDAAAAYVQTEGGASMREIVAAVLPDHSLGYEVPDLEEGERYRGAWWRRIVRDGLKNHPDVQQPGPGGNEWRPAD
jgi:hypothetical protein